MRLRHVAYFILFFIFAESVFAASGVFGFEVVIQKPDSSYLQDPNVDFKFTITDDSGACVIYSEDHNGVDMSGTNGQKTFQLGNTLLQTYPNPLVTTLTIDQVFSSSGVVYNCQGGGTYTSTSSASRKVVMEFNDGSGLQTLPAMAINSVPYAVEAQKVVSNSITTQNILDGTITAADLSSMGAATGQVMKWNGSAWVASNDLTGTNLVTSVAGRTGAVVLSSSDISGLGSLAGKNQIQLSTDVTGFLPLANLAQSSATIGQVIKWNGSAWVVSNDDSGTNLVTSVAGRTGAVTLSSADISGIGFGTTSGTFAQGNDARFTDERNPINNSVTSAKIADGTIQSADLSAGSVTLDKLNQSAATTGQVIKWSGSAWVVSDDASGGGGSVTNVTASGPLSSTGGTTPNITIAQASGTTSGYLSSTDFSTFAAKLSDFTTLTSADITGKLGYTPVNPATAVISVAGRTGAVTLSSSDISGLGTLAGKNQVNLSTDVTGTLPLANIAQSAATTGQVIKWNGSAWVVSNDITGSGSQWLATGSDIYFNTGNVGIGTTAPNLTGYSSNASVLTVAGSGDAGNGQGILELQNSRTTATVGDSVGNISFLSKNNNGLEKRAAIISSTLSGSGGPNGFGGTMYFSVKSDNTASTSIAMTIKENGYVGIGTPNPSHNLDVVGDVNVTGNFKVNGVNISAGGGTVTSVTASGPLSSTGGATPNITITRATAGADGYLSSTDFSSFAAKLSDFSTLTSADITGKLGYTPLANFTSMVSGDVTAALGYVPANVGSVILASQMPANCNAGQTLTFSSPTGAWVCSSIVLANNSVTSSMISSLDWSKVVNTPSNLAGYGVTLLSSDIPSIDATKVTSGVFNTARLGTGTADSSTYLRGDGTWTSPSAAPVLNSNPFYQVRVATTGAITLSGTQTIDGVAVVAGDRVLVKNQSLANVRQNGVYVVSAGAWTRATEMDTWSEVLGYRVQVTSGTTNIGMTYTASVLASGTIDVSNIYFMAAGSQNGYLGSVSLGYGALISESAATNANIAIGSDSLTRNTTGYVNTSIGAGAMAYTTTGYNNTAIGYQALRYNTENTDSTAVGKNAMQNANAAAGNNPTYNTALGVNALQMPTAPLASNTGTQNTAIGHSTLAGLSSGIGNTAVGYNAGSALTTGSYNVIIGNNSGSTFATGSNNISINDGAGNERIRINSAGRVGIGLNNPSYAVDVSGDVNVTGNFKVNGFNISSGSSALSSLTAATAANTIDSNNFDQTWNWSTLNTQTAMSMNANALTTGSILSLATSNASVNSTNGLLYVANNSASTNGTVARIQSNSTAGSGLTVLANGYVGIGTASPSYTLDLPGGQVRSKTAAFENSDANSSGSTFSFWKHRNYANTQANDELGFMSFWGYETILRRGAYIAANQEAVVAGSVPTKITFATASSGDADASEKMTLTGMGRLGIGVSNPNYAVDVSGDLNITGNFKVNGVNIGSGSGTVSSGTTNKLAYYTGATTVGSNTNMSVSSGALTLGTAGSALGSLAVTGNTSGTVTIQPQAAAGTYNFNLPTTAGTSGQVLTSGGGVGAPMTWLTLANSASVDTTNASNITSGTLPAGRLPAHTGDVTSSAGSAALSIANNAVTAAKLESGTNGQLFIGNGTGFTKATLTGTTNQVNVANGSGTITLSTPQNIHSAATPTFAGLTLSGVAGNTLVKTNGSGVLSNATSADVTGLLGYTPQTLNTELTGLAGLSSNGFIRRTAAGTYSSVSSIDLSSQVSGLLPLNNLAQSAAGYGQVIKWDGSSWIASDDNSSGSGGGSGSTVDPGWPDMIYCSGSAGAVILYWTYSDNTGNRVYRANDSNQSTSYLQIVYTSAGAYSTTQVSGAGWTNYYTSCTSQSIAQLYGAGKAYNVVGGGGGVWTQSGANTYFSGGNVGVGILSPSFAVDVSGDINITGNFRVNGSILATGSGTVASGTTNKLAYYTGATTVSSNTNMSVSSGALTLGTAGSALGSLAVTGNTSGTVTIQPQAAAGTYNFNLPTTAGTSGQVLTSGGGASAPMTWLTLANSASVDTTNASNITSGTLPAGRLPAFTGDVTTSAGSSATTIANNAVTSAKILDGTIVSADISSAAITFDKLNQSSATTGQVIKWNGSAWIASNDASGLTGVTSADITTALSYTPVNKSGDTMSGALNLPSNGLVVGSNELVVSGSKVGVGTNSPTGVLQLGTGNTAVKFGNTGSTDARALISAADLKLYTYDTDGVTNGTILLDVGKTSTQFNPGSVQSMLSLNDEGKLGLSTFPLNRLDVWGNAAFGSYAGSATAPSNGLIVSGNVGVGTNSPSYALEVAGGSGYYSGLFRGTNTTTRLGVENSAVAAWGNAAELEFRLDGNDRGKIAVVTTNSAAESYDMTFHTKTSNFPYERMRIRNDGYVGIGTASPYSMLDVAGSVKVGTDSTACSNNLKGALRLNSSVLEFCNGTSWGPLGGLTNFTESVNTSAPNATIPAVQLAATNGAADVDFVIKAKGDGSILAQTPDNTTTGGNKRGVRAVDLQMLRSGSTMVASGSYSVIAGGYNNTASGSGSAVSGGIENLASVGLSLVGAGYRNTAQANYATIVGGQVNNVTSQYGFIGNGYRNDVFGNYASVVNGQNNIASGANSVVLNGNSNVASGDYSSAMGMGSTSPAYAQTTVGQYNMPTGSENLTSWVATDPLFVIGNGTGSGASRSNAVMVLKNGSVGIGTSSPRTSFDVTGAIVSRASQSFSAGTIDFSVSNLRHTTQNCGAFALHNLKDGGTYMFAVQGTTVATCSFTAFSDAGSTALTVHMPPDHAATTSGKHTIYNIAVMGTHAYIAWTPGY